MGLEFLEIAVGIIFVYLLVSILCTAVREGLEAYMKTRGAYLWLGIRQLLDDKKMTGLAESFRQHPLISSLFTGPTEKDKLLDTPKMLDTARSAPSYIPSRNFAVALMDIAARGPVTHDATSSSGAPVVSLENIRANIANVGNPAVQRVLLNAVDTAQGDIRRAQAHIEAWYDGAMDRVSGWYKRTTHWWLLAIGMLVAVGMNINTLTILDYLSTHPKERTALADRADAYLNKVKEADATAAQTNQKNESNTKTENAATSPSIKTNYQEAKKMLNGLNLPIGWKRMKFFTPAEICEHPGLLGSAVLVPLFGWLLTAVAASLGAPFWFDLLNKVMVIRSTVKPHEKSPEEGSEDRQAKAQQPATTVVVPPGPQPPPAPAPPPPDAGSPSVAGRDPEANLDDSHASIKTPTNDDELPEAKGGVQ